MTWMKFFAGSALGLAGATLGQILGAMANRALDGELGEWGEYPASLGLVVRTFCEVILPGLGSALGIYATGAWKGESKSRAGLAALWLAATTGSFIGWMLSYAFSPIMWILLPALFAVVAGSAIDAWHGTRPRAFKIGAGASGVFLILLALPLWSEYQDQPNCSFKVSLAARAEDGRVTFPQRPDTNPEFAHVWATARDGQVHLSRVIHANVWARTRDGKDEVVAEAHSPGPLDQELMWQGHKVAYRLDEMGEEAVRFEVNIAGREESFDSYLVVPVGGARVFLPEGAPLGLRIQVARLNRP